eukprot:NODE_448_length_7291_cov_0.696329.p2 type:complete len:316 gc:universal NODE_448_length_7291_cov_0.696329:1068-121(-)
MLIVLMLSVNGMLNRLFPLNEIFLEMESFATKNAYGLGQCVIVKTGCLSSSKCSITSELRKKAKDLWRNFIQALYETKSFAKYFGLFCKEESFLHVIKRSQESSRITKKTKKWILTVTALVSIAAGVMLGFTSSGNGVHINAARSVVDKLLVKQQNGCLFDETCTKNNCQIVGQGDLYSDSSSDSTTIEYPCVDPSTGVCETLDGDYAGACQNFLNSEENGCLVDSKLTEPSGGCLALYNELQSKKNELLRAQQNANTKKFLEIISAVVLSFSSLIFFWVLYFTAIDLRKMHREQSALRNTDEPVEPVEPAESLN